MAEIAGTGRAGGRLSGEAYVGTHRARAHSREAAERTRRSRILAGLTSPARVGEGAQAVSRRRATWADAYRRRAVAGDVVVSVLTGVVTGLLAFPGWSLTRTAVAAAVMPVLWVGALSLGHGYEGRYVGTAPEEYRAVVRTACYLVAAAGLVSYGLRVDVPRAIPLVAAPMLVVLGLIARRILRSDLGRRRRAGTDTQATVIIGNARSVAPMIAEIQRAPEQGLRVVAACVSGLDLSGDVPSEVNGVPVFGYPEEAMSAVDLFDAEVVAVSSDPDLHGPELRRLAWSLEEREVDLVVSAGLLGVAGPRLSIRPTAGMPLLHVERPVMSGARRVLKVAMERLLTAVLLLAALPVGLAIALAIRVDSPGPILFRQNRVGARGEPFSMLKFRTMCVDAEERLAALQRDAGNDVMFKMKDDPRVTRVGRLLRRYSLDELPQLLNVIAGQMSLVGPRPALQREVDAYEPDAVRRLRVRPGLTGLWQVSGRSNLSWDESLRLDLWYVDNWSMVLDLQILFRTARAVLRGTGAY
ncbi:sugar transferase [Pedococcus sp. NPDC057267]|uniref:sugar transferase n=1 Tax=Pedococcus sp. NPDC057267 TaxID=3346077 RepID=UPI00362FCE87